MKYQRIIVEKDAQDERLLWIKLNRPEKLNVLDLRMLQELYSALVKADKDKGVQAILIMC